MLPIYFWKNVAKFWGLWWKENRIALCKFVNMVEKKMEKDYGWSRGEESEEKVCRVLEELKTEGKIKNFGRNLKFYQEDLSGRDVLITTNNDKVIWLQVKSSFNPIEKEKYRRKGIHYLGGVSEKTPEEIKKEILEILQQKGKLQKASIKEKTEVSI